jgi:hypothetical protein
MTTKQLLRGREIEPETCKIEDHAGRGGNMKEKGESNMQAKVEGDGDSIFIFPRGDFDGGENNKVHGCCWKQGGREISSNMQKSSLCVQ